MTSHEEVDEVTGLSRKIVVDSPDEKKQPLIEVRDKNGKVTRKYHMPSHAHLMVEDGEPVSRARCSRRFRARRRRRRTSPAACRASSNCSRRASRARRR